MKAIHYSIYHLQAQSSKKHQNILSNILKLNKNDTRMASHASIVNFEHILHFYSTVNTAEFEQMSAGSEKRQFQTINLFLVTEKYVALWAGKICQTMFSSLFTQYKVAKGYIFTTALQKDKPNFAYATNKQNHSSLPRDIVALSFWRALVKPSKYYNI